MPKKKATVNATDHVPNKWTDEEEQAYQEKIEADVARAKKIKELAEQYKEELVLAQAMAGVVINSHWLALDVLEKLLSAITPMLEHSEEFVDAVGIAKEEIA